MLSLPPENQNNPEALPPDPFATLEPVPQTPFNLLRDGHSIEMDAEGFRIHNVMRPREDDEVPLSGDSGGKLYTSDRDNQPHVSSEYGTPLSTSALFAGHVAVRTGENVHVDSGIVIEDDDEGNPSSRPGVSMPIGSYVEDLKKNGDEIYAPQHGEFNFNVQTMYQDGRMVMPPEMELGPEDQLVAAHAARKMMEDDRAGKFPATPPRPKQGYVDSSIAAMETRLTNEKFDEVVQGVEPPKPPDDL